MTLFPQHPSNAVTTKKFNYLLVKTGTLMLKARSDLRGYIPGQVIKLATEIHNKSGKDTGCVLASLIQVIIKCNLQLHHTFLNTLNSICSESSLEILFVLISQEVFTVFSGVGYRKSALS